MTRDKPVRLSKLLRKGREPFRIAVDTEFTDAHTLTVQFVLYFRGKYLVQVYHSSSLDARPSGILGLIRNELGEIGRPIVLQPARLLHPNLSPARILADLLGVRNWKFVTRSAAERTLGRETNQAPSIEIVFVGHFFPADFLRMFGAAFFDDLTATQFVGGPLEFSKHKAIRFNDRSDPYRQKPGAVLEYVEQTDGALFPVRVDYFDTNTAVGSSSLDELAYQFLGRRKSTLISKAEKQNMEATFKERPGEAYAYAIVDAVQTLLIYERMCKSHAQMYLDLDLQGETPRFHPTPGRRAAELILRSAAKAVSGSSTLITVQKSGADQQTPNIQLRKLLAQFKKGSAVVVEHGSRFGRQTGETHGGLSFTRSPTQSFHDAPASLLDVDLSGCYASILGRMHLYIGRPVCYEPGAKRMKLIDAIKFVEAHAVARDGWVIRATGPITASPNVLVPSTRGAITHKNVDSRRRKARMKSEDAAPARHDAEKATGRSMIYTGVVESGIIAWPTWLMIQAMPPALRCEYEDLEVETILFYPKRLVADDGPAFDALVAKLKSGDLSWTEDLDMEGLRKHIAEKLDDDYAALRFNVGGLLCKISVMRRKAREEFGKGSGAELSWKLFANSSYGVLASRHLPTQNVVAANYITATARALAFTMQMSLNGIQVITDGCSYRADQVPAGTFAELLERRPDYPLRRPDSIEATPTIKVPKDDVAFTAWYQRHVKRFFGVDGKDYDALFGLHSLEHKTTETTSRKSFDAMCCDGSTNNVKFIEDGDDLKMVDVKARSVGRAAHKELAEWLLKVTRDDDFEPSPLFTSRTLLRLKEAFTAARTAARALKDGGESDEVYLPLGLERRRQHSYKLIKPSAFLFQSPRQHKAWEKAYEQFNRQYGGGFELLALRRGSDGRRRGSIIDVAEWIYRLIQEGVKNPSNRLSLTKTCVGLKKAVARLAVKQRMKEEEDERFRCRIARSELSEEQQVVGLFATLRDLMDLSR